MHEIMGELSGSGLNRCRHTVWMIKNLAVAGKPDILWVNAAEEGCEIKLGKTEELKYQNETLHQSQSIRLSAQVVR